MINEIITNLDRRKNLQKVAEEFSNKLKTLKNVSEVGLAGSLASDDEYPNDIDVFIFLKNFDEIHMIAKFARQMSSIYHGWEVFVFSEDLEYLGRICHKKVCPTESSNCFYPRCGKIPYLSNEPDFIFNPKIFFNSPFKIFWTRDEAYLWEKWRKKLNICEVRQYAEHNPISKICIECGREFIYSVAEQKIFAKRGFHPPKRCERCRLNKNLL